VPPDWALLLEDVLAVVSTAPVDVLAGALAIELLWVVPDPLPPHPASASPTVAARAAAQTSRLVARPVADAIAAVSLIIPPCLVTA